MQLSTADKAQAINFSFGVPSKEGGQVKIGPVNFRGAIAEIGAGQEVARHFFQAAATSRTIVKTMSAYGKGCSNAIYDGEMDGQDQKKIGERNSNETPFISEERLKKMLNHDYELLLTRDLHEDEKPKSLAEGEILRHFAFANTVDLDPKKNHGWAGVRVQISGCALKARERAEANEVVEVLENNCLHEKIAAEHGPVIDFRIHFSVLSRDKASKMKNVGALGVNLLYAALRHCSQHHSIPEMKREEVIQSMLDNIVPTELRIDRFAVEKSNLKIDNNRPEGRRLECEPVEPDYYGSISESFCVELVKTSTVRCAVFAEPKRPAIISHRLTKTPHAALVLTRSACTTSSLELEKEMLQKAKTAFVKDLGRDFKGAQIVGAIHFPILAALSPEIDQSGLSVFVSRENEPEPNRKLRAELINKVTTEEIILRVENILATGNAALVSEFSASSEILKFLRTRTKLSDVPITKEQAKGASSGVDTNQSTKYNPATFTRAQNIALVFRADQFVEALINIEERVKDREAMEFVGSMIRRGAKFYVYPCLRSCILNGKTRYSTPIKNAFSKNSLQRYKKQPNVSVRLESLMGDLSPEYKHILEYMNDSKRKCIGELDSKNEKLMGMSLEPASPEA